MANKSGQTFELPKRSSMIAELLSTQEERDEATREKVMDIPLSEIDPCAGFLLANGMSMKEVQDWLGHSTFKTTADTYAHLDFKSKLNSADALSVETAFAKIPQ